jgi:hypothetical protein
MVVYPHIDRHWLMLGAATAGVLAGGGAGWLIVRHHRPTPEQVEERRRRRLAESGRIVDGSLIDAVPQESTPQKIIYSYRIAGVTYECSQDVSKLGPMVENYRLDYPVQVRYSRDNPADSIVVSETWNGLWTNIWRASGARKAELTGQER